MKNKKPLYFFQYNDFNKIWTIHHFLWLIRLVNPIHYSLSLISLFLDKPDIGDCISISLNICKISTFGYNSTERKDVAFYRWIGLEKWFTSFTFQKCKFQKRRYLGSFIRYIQGFLYKSILEYFITVYEWWLFLQSCPELY